MHPVGKTIHWIKKMFGTFYDGHNVLYHCAKFGEIEQCTPAIGAKIGCLYVSVFVFFLSVTLRSAGALLLEGHIV